MAGLRRDRNFQKLSEDHQTYAVEEYDVTQQVLISEKRNVVELFSSFTSKVHLCGRFKYLVEVIYLCLGKYIRRERYAIKNICSVRQERGCSEMEKLEGELFFPRENFPFPRSDSCLAERSEGRQSRSRKRKALEEKKGA